MYIRENITHANLNWKTVHRYVQRLRLYAKFSLVRNCSWLIDLITVLFFLFMPPPLPAFCEMRLCYKYYKFDARNRFIGSLFTDFQYKCFFAAIKGRVTNLNFWLLWQTEKCSEFRRKLLSINERNFRVLPKSREKFWLEKFSPLNNVIGNR